MVSESIQDSCVLGFRFFTQVFNCSGKNKGIVLRRKYKMCHFTLFWHSFLLVFLSQTSLAYSWGWFSSSSTETRSKDDPSSTYATSKDFNAEFSIAPISNPKGLQLVENALKRRDGPNSCWRNAYENLFAGCSEIIADKEKQSRLAWHLSDCFQKDSGRTPFPSCDSGNPMVKCLKNLDSSSYGVYLEFFLETNSICHQLQGEAFKHQTERLVNELKQSAQFAEDKLETIEERSGQLLDNTNQIHNSLSSIDLQIEQMSQASKDVEEQIDVVLNYSRDIFQKSREIATSQSELQGGQAEMRQKLEEGMRTIEESYISLGEDIEKLSSGAKEIQKKINEVSTSMSIKMNNLQSTTDNIQNIAGVSLDKQQEVLDGQLRALEGLDELTTFQSQALEESRNTLQNLADFGQKQQEELLRRQHELQLQHNLLAQNSRSILEAQEAFERKQTDMFDALDKLFALHNAILRESRSFKALLQYTIITFVVYLLTSAKQTYNVRARLYLGIWITFLVEFAMVRYWDSLELQTWIESKITLARYFFLVVAFIQIIASIITYRDYEVLNHNMLRNLMDRVNNMEKQKYLEAEEESSVDFSSWIDTNLSEDEDLGEDPDYVLHEEVAENSVAACSLTKKYDLRPRLRC